MAGRGGRTGGQTGGGPGGEEAREESSVTAHLALDRTGVATAARRIRAAGAGVADDAQELVAALEEASAAAAGVRMGPGAGLVTGPALTECAAILARRVRDVARETGELAREMTRAAGLLADADEEVARRVSGAGG